MLNDSPRLPWLFSGMAVLGVALFGLSTGVLMAPWLPALGSRLGEVTCLQVAYTGARAAAILGSFSPEQRTAIAGLMFPGDTTFAFAYGLLLAGLLGLLALRLPTTWRQRGSWLMWAPLGATLFDCSENWFIYVMALASSPADTGFAPLLGGLSATVKYCLLCLVTPAWGVAGAIRLLAADRQPAALLIGALVLLATIPMFITPVRQLPACF